jgi:hypothetical protein
MYFERRFHFDHLLSLQLSLIVAHTLTCLWIIFHLNTWSQFLLLFEFKNCILMDTEGSSVKHQSSSKFCATLYTDTGCISLLNFVIGFVAVSGHLCKLVIRNIVRITVLLLLFLLLYYCIFRYVQHKNHYVFRNLGFRLSKTYLESQSIVKMAGD